jgi:acetylornithine deacetylase/succinyl-diaminopimelate desuccinylase family protein
MINKTSKNLIITCVEQHREELIRLVSELVRIRSISPNYPGIKREEVLGGETKVNEIMKQKMDLIGLKTDLWEEETGRANLVGVLKSTGKGKSLIFNGHVDVVPAGAEEFWTEALPWSGEVKDGKIYGRGTCDMKGGNAAAFIGLKALLAAGFKPEGDVILEYVVGEEGKDTDAGTGAVIARGYRADAAIVVEPSAPPYRLGILTASPGVLTLKVTVRGKRSHTCMWDDVVRAGGAGEKVAVSAIDKAMIIYQGLKNLDEEWGQTKAHPAFTRPGHFTICPTGFVSGINGISNIPDECYMEYAIWHAPQETDVEVKREIEEQINRFAQTDPWLRQNPPELLWYMWWPPFHLDADAPFCNAVTKAYETAMDKPAKMYGFAAVCDASFLSQSGISTITMGPGHLRNAHAFNENIDINELVDAAKIYALTIAEWCGIS